jgi:predicted nucleotidyltransferase
VLTTEEIDALVARVVARVRPEQVIVFGSYAKGSASRNSDLDLCVVVDTPLPPARRADALRPLLAGCLVPVDVHVHTPEEMREYGKEQHSFLHSVLASGKVVYSAT